MPSIRFAKLSAPRFDSLGDGNRFTFDDLDGLRSSRLLRDTNFMAVVGDDDAAFEPGETAFKLADVGFGGRLLGLDATALADASDPVAISAHGMANRFKIGDLTDHVRYTDDGFGVASRGERGDARTTMSNGESISFDSGALNQTELLRFTVELPGDGGTVDLALDVDGNVITGPQGLVDGYLLGVAPVADALLTIPGLTDGDVVEIDPLAKEIRVDGVALDSDTTAFFEAFADGDSRQLTVGNLGDQAASIRDVSLAVTSPYTLQIDDERSALSLSLPLADTSSLDVSLMANRFVVMRNPDWFG